MIRIIELKKKKSPISVVSFFAENNLIESTESFFPSNNKRFSQPLFLKKFIIQYNILTFLPLKRFRSCSLIPASLVFHRSFSFPLSVIN